MSLDAFLGAIEIGLIYSLVALGIFISFRLLRFPDLTVDGSFTLGAAVTALLIVEYGVNPYAATAAGTLAGFCAGLVTATLSVKFKIMDLLASILVMTALYSVNLRVMGKPNIPLFADPTFFDSLPFFTSRGIMFNMLVMLFVVFIVKLIMDWFFSTEIGLSIRATGTNARMARAQGVPTGRMMMLGLAISNSLVGLAGSLFAQSQGGADASMGIGTIVIGLAAVIVGERIIPARGIFWATLAVVVGAVLYRLFIAVALQADSIGLQAQDLNLITAVLVTFVLIFPLALNFYSKVMRRDKPTQKTEK
ncbi:MAG: ABC transporter permease [Saezia sp.]